MVRKDQGFREQVGGRRVAGRVAPALDDLAALDAKHVDAGPGLLAGKGDAQDRAAGHVHRGEAGDDPVPLCDHVLRGEAEGRIGFSQGGEVAHQPVPPRQGAGLIDVLDEVRGDDGAQGRFVCRAQEEVDRVVEAPDGGFGGGVIRVGGRDRVGRREKGVSLAEPGAGHEGEDAGDGSDRAAHWLFSVRGSPREPVRQG